jgi:hypothetical protein
MPELSAIRCSRCGEVAHRLVTPPVSHSGTPLAAPAGPVCEKCLAEIEREYTEDQQATRPAPGPAAIQDEDEPDPDDPDAPPSEELE